MPVDTEDLEVKYFKDLNDVSSVAIFSTCDQYRYLLRRTWSKDGPNIVFVMLNPSTATELKNDPTVERCQRRASERYGSFTIVNIFALRSTDPKALYVHSDPVGERNDEMIIDACRDADKVICGWGNHGILHQRGAQVMKLIRTIPKTVFAFKITKSGQPQHPLYISYATDAVAIPVPPVKEDRNNLLA
jgi:hypothetical protein